MPQTTYRVFDPETHPFYSPALAEYPLIRDGIACCEVARQDLLRAKDANPALYRALGGDEALRFAADQLRYESERADWFGMDLSGVVFVEDDGRWEAVVLNRLGQVLEISPRFEGRDAAEDWAEECYGERVAS
jgi:hypothetical protein